MTVRIKTEIWDDGVHLFMREAFIELFGSSWKTLHNPQKFSWESQQLCQIVTTNPYHIGISGLTFKPSET